MGRRRKRRKRGRENEREGEGEKRRERERRGENRKGGTKNVPPSPNAFPSTKLGKNITPIKGRLGKNTTPKGRGSLELNQNPMWIPCDDDQASTLHFEQIPITHQKGKKIQSMGSMAKEPPFIRMLKHSKNHTITFDSP